MDALWATEETLNAYLHLQDVGWRKLYDGREAFHALLPEAVRARQGQATVSVLEGPDQMIYEIRPD